MVKGREWAPASTGPRYTSHPPWPPTSPWGCNGFFSSIPKICTHAKANRVGHEQLKSALQMGILRSQVLRRSARIAPLRTLAWAHPALQSKLTTNLHHSACCQHSKQVNTALTPFKQLCHHFDNSRVAIQQNVLRTSRRCFCLAMAPQM